MVFVSKGKRSSGLGEVARVIPVTVHYCQIVNSVGKNVGRSTLTFSYGQRKMTALEDGMWERLTSTLPVPPTTRDTNQQVERNLQPSCTI
jgi:hypothetical protein